MGEMVTVSAPDMLRAAQWYAHHGFRLLPLDGKMPHSQLLPREYSEEKGREVPSWSPLALSGPKPDDLLRWFEAEKANIGIATGYSGYVVVDCDSREEALWWWENRPRTSMMVRTGKGVHFYYKAPSTQVGNRAKIGGRAIDFRGHGGYVVAAPSVHPNGKPYRRCGEWDLNDVPEFDPDWFGASSDTAVRRNLRPLSDPEALAERAMSYLGHIYAVSGQSGHGQTFRAANVLKDFGVGEGQALELMKVWNETNAIPQWSVEELAHKVRDAYAR